MRRVVGCTGEIFQTVHLHGKEKVPKGCALGVPTFRSQGNEEESFCFCVKLFFKNKFLMVTFLRGDMMWL